MTRTAREALLALDQLLIQSGLSTRFTPDDLATISQTIGDGLDDLDERPQPEPVGTVREALGGILDVANRLTAGLPERDRLVELVQVGLGDIQTRPQTDPGPVELEPWQREKAIELALRWYEIDGAGAGTGVLERAAQIQAVMRGEQPQLTVRTVPQSRMIDLAESWQAVADELPATDSDARAVWEACARQLRRATSGG